MPQNIPLDDRNLLGRILSGERIEPEPLLELDFDPPIPQIVGPFLLNKINGGTLQQNEFHFILLRIDNFEKNAQTFTW